MGFDLYGMNPQADTPEPAWTKGDPWVRKTQDDCLDENSSATQMEINPQLKEEYDDYMKTRLEWQDSTEGSYFRNNVWFWRPLWSFVCGACGDILTRNDVEQGSYNDGHKISKTKAKRIASRLRRYLKDGHVDAYESWYARKVSQLKDDDCNKNYPFSIDNVKEFERFCEHSGGFQIY